MSMSSTPCLSTDATTARLVALGAAAFAAKVQNSSRSPPSLMSSPRVCCYAADDPPRRDARQLRALPVGSRADLSLGDKDVTQTSWCATGWAGRVVSNPIGDDT